MEFNPKQINSISGATGLNPNKVKSFLTATGDGYNRRYELIYSWVRLESISYKQMKILFKNIKVTDIEFWVKLNGDYLFEPSNMID